MASQGLTPLRDGAAIRGAPLSSFGNYDTAGTEPYDNLVAAQERIVSQERAVEKTIEKPIVTPTERIIERAVEVPKRVERNVITEVPVPEVVVKTIQVIKEVPVETVVEKQVVRKKIVERLQERVVEVIKEVPVERIIEQVVEVVKEVPVEKVIERIQVREVPVIETEERVVEVIKEVPVEIVKEVPVYVKVDAAEWEARHNLRASAPELPAIGGVGMLLGRNEANIFTAASTYVLELVPGGPARECGKIGLNDILLKVDGRDISQWSLRAVHDAIEGPVDAPIDLEFQKNYEGYDNGTRYGVTLYRKALGTNYSYRSGPGTSSIKVLSAHDSQPRMRSSHEFATPNKDNSRAWM